MKLDDHTLRAALDAPDRGWRSKEGLRDAAILAPVFRRDDEDWLLFTVRRDDLDVHAGEVSFPGGMREGDEDALACALRETHEEIGLEPSAVDVLGRMRDCTSVAGFRVHVFVGRMPPPDGLVIDPREVASLLPIPVAQLRREERWQWRDLDHPKIRHKVPFFGHDGEMLWGMTARVALDLLALV